MPLQNPRISTCAVPMCALHPHPFHLLPLKRRKEVRTASQQFRTGSETKDQKMVVTLARKAMIKNPNCNAPHSNILSRGYIRNMIS